MHMDRETERENKGKEQINIHLVIKDKESQKYKKITKMRTVTAKMLSHTHRHYRVDVRFLALGWYTTGSSLVGTAQMRP